MKESIYLSYLDFPAWLYSGERGWHVSGTELRGWKK